MMGMMGNSHTCDSDPGRDETPARLGLLRADDGIRTRDPHLGKVMLYQLSHVRVAV